jgi:CheY-like chemotaxis protein
MTLVYLVDDEKSYRDTAVILLRKRGVNVRAFSSPCDLLALLRDDRLHHLELPKFVVMDLYMPEMDGIELTQLIHGEFPEIKLFCLTGGDEGLIGPIPEVMRELGCSRIFLKPVDFDVLAGALAA